jgi:hypothetical protein
MLENGGGRVSSMDNNKVSALKKRGHPRTLHQHISISLSALVQKRRR